ncbi:MAG: hypothetical protein KAV42_07890 [Candidatus Krumholzibacteria bacterium]|nr:hypothetical protein [Candidatus Krumholzibacteria bacterium]
MLTPTLDQAFRIGAALPYLALAVAVLAGRLKQNEERESFPRGIIAISIFYAGLIAVLYIYNGLLLVRSDAWYHASLVSEISTRGIPPMEPWLADAPVRYMWIYHLFLASWKNLSSLSLFTSMGVFNIIAAFSFPYLVARLVAHFTTNRRYIQAIPFLAIAGLESASWIMWPIGLGRAFFGEVTGFSEVSRQLQLALAQANSCEVIRFLRPYGTWMVNLTDKFLTITAFSYSLNLLLLALVFFISFRSGTERRIRTAFLIMTTMLGAFLFHVITGTALICTVFGAGVLLPLIDRFIHREKPSMSDWLLLPAAALIAASLGIPYFLSLGAAGQSVSPSQTGPLHIGLKNIATILLPLLILFRPSRQVFIKLFSRKYREYNVFAAWILCLLALNILVDLPTRNESKLIYPLFLVLGIPLYIEVIHWIRESAGAKKRLVLIFIFVLFLFPPLLTMRGFAIDRGQGPVEKRRFETAHRDREVYEWIRENTAENSVFAERNLDHLPAVYGERRVLFSDRGVMKVLGYGGEKYESYRVLRDMLYSETPFSMEDLETIRATGLDIYVTLWNEDSAEYAGLEVKYDHVSDWFDKVFENEKVRLYRFRTGKSIEKE